MMTIKMRKELTAEWQDRGITQEKDYAILTNEMTKAWSGLSIQEYKNTWWKICWRNKREMKKKWEKNYFSCKCK